MHLGRPRGDRNILEGDIVVTAVGDHYAIGRRKADGKTQEFLGLLFNRISQASRAPRAHAVAVGSFVDVPSIAQTGPLRCGTESSPSRAL